MRIDLNEIQHWVKQNSRVLDLGCGDGTLLKFLTDSRNVQGYGLEIDAEQINALLTDTLRRIESEFDDELPSRAIADAVMHGLRTVDSIAWLRYASFYEDFTQFSRFAEEILYLGGERAGENSGG